MPAKKSHYSLAGRLPEPPEPPEPFVCHRFHTGCILYCSGGGPEAYLHPSIGESSGQRTPQLLFGVITQKDQQHTASGVNCTCTRGRRRAALLCEYESTGKDGGTLSEERS
jgi:hypothetical protein